jgi:hypothetical protein
VNRDPQVVSDITLEPSATSDESRVLALLESRLGERVPVYEVEAAGRLQYAARVHSLRHIYGYAIVNGQSGKTSEGRKKTWFALIGRLTLCQRATLENLCRRKRRYSRALVEVFPEAGTYLSRGDRDKTCPMRNYPAPQVLSTPPSPQLGPLVKESYGV